ncbi:hypothetical protein TVAG_263340 [Trichomonas vaginalis G3]|uniref:Uncharacterized protein n=1 Tax=Trichomonas vaginalis (strain ATCC PRA-98 / G3) TaxID=412133 RepID=A2FA81_TRIV3|nr:hypothetical protein TVAGG3_0390810 [Trichomonas vaginalis G3]EAX98217.1 hypothetical protein TVAG_263340 [Trichomonas vaginalis G3]KAI5533977.1 hypothetical protein TVAGG3_0390810 [Trichomonas vaginalis G3]|eukprot:XP_001311147.1 hypothetical protein [Trichomonas vaginalis G3]
MADQDPFKQEIREPSDTITDQLSRTKVDFESKSNMPELIKNSITQVMSKVDEVDNSVIDIIGAQMEFLTAEFQDCIKATQDLFTALTNLKDGQTEIVRRKASNATSLASSIEKTMTCIRRLGDDK